MNAGHCFNFVAMNKREKSKLKLKSKANLNIYASAGREMVVEASLTGATANIRIVDRIDTYTESSSREVSAIVQELIKKGATSASVYINSAGGNVFEANEIINELNKFSQLTIQVGALAASAATRILVAFKDSATAYQTSQFMIHRPKGYMSGDVDTIESQLKLLRNITEDYKKAYMEAFGKTEDEIEALWGKGDYWMSAAEAKKMGLIANLIEAKAPIKAEDITLLEACGAPVIPEKETESNLNTMNKERLKSLLGLAADATDAQIEAAVEAAKASADTVEAMQAQMETARAGQVEALITDAILGKKITADQKDTWTKLATADFDGTKAALDALPGIQKPTVQPGAQGDTSVKAGWTLDDYLTKDPEAYEKLKVENPEAAAELEKAYFGK